MKMTIIALAAILVTGCVSVDYGDFHYRSIGRDVQFEVDPETGKVRYGSNVNVDVISSTAEGVARGLKP